MEDFKEITIRTVQGVGDIFWVYQKLSPYFDKINLVICVVNMNCDVQKRSLPFVKTLPKIQLVKFLLVSSDEYQRIANIHKTLFQVFNECANKVFPIEYAVNGWLEDGVRIDDIDPKFRIEEYVNLKETPVDIPYDEYIILYISGNKITQEWGPKKYATLIYNTYTKYNKSYPIILLGAKYDLKHLTIANNELTKYGYSTKLMIDYKFEEVNYIIKHSKYFIGYQSGLCILADNYDIPQTMLYFNFLDKVMFSWPKIKNINANIYNAFKFNENIDILKNFDTI